MVSSFDLFINYGFAIFCIFVFSTLLIKYSNFNNLIFANSKIVFLFFIAFVTISNSLLIHLKLENLRYYVDLATHLEILSNFSKTLKLDTFLSLSHHGTSNWFAAHFTPIIYISYVPVFLLWNSPISLFLLLTLILYSGVIPIYLISKTKFDSNISLIFCCIYLLYPNFSYVNIYGPSYLEFCIPMFLWAFYFYESRKIKMMTLILLISCLIREEVSLTVAAFGLFLFFEKKIDRLYSIFILCFSLLYFYLVINHIIPYFKKSEEHLALVLFNEWGSNYFEILLNILKNPFKFLKYELLDYIKLTNILMFMIMFCCINFLNLKSVIIILPSLLIALLSRSFTHSSYILYYMLPMVPAIFYGLIKNNFINKKTICFIFYLSLGFYIFFSPSIISVQFWFKDFKLGKYNTTDFYISSYFDDINKSSINEILNKIPPNISISAEQKFLPLLYEQKSMNVFPEVNNSNQFILIDLDNKYRSGYGSSYMEFRKDPNYFYDQFIFSDDWKTIGRYNDVFLLKRKNDV